MRSKSYSKHADEALKYELGPEYIMPTDDEEVVAMEEKVMHHKMVKEDVVMMDSIPHKVSMATKDSRESSTVKSSTRSKKKKIDDGLVYSGKESGESRGSEKEKEGVVFNGSVAGVIDVMTVEPPIESLDEIDMGVANLLFEVYLIVGLVFLTFILID